MANLPTILQMVNRANSGHVSALRKLSADRAVCGPTALASEIRGMRVVLATLARWGCVETHKVGEIREQIGPDAWHIIEKGHYETTVTPRGTELLAAIEERQGSRCG